MLNWNHSLQVYYKNNNKKYKNNKKSYTYGPIYKTDNVISYKIN